MATGYYLTIKATESNINVNNNTSVVNVVVTAHRPSNSTGGWANANTPLVINCDGQTRNITVGSYDFRNYSSKEIGNASFTITHNTDGSKSVNISGDWTSGSSAVLGTSGTQHITGSTTLKLTTIPRASSITLDKSSATYGETLKITINRASSSFKHMLQVICNGDSPTPIAENVDTSYNYTIPEWIATRLIQQNNKLVIRCITYNNGTELGYVNSSDVIITTPASFKPTITFSSSDSKKLDEVFGGYVKSQSEVTIKSTASIKQGAYVVTHNLTNGSQNASNQAWENSITTTSDLKEWTATVKDSRGLSTTEKYKPTTYDWYNPIISNANATRSDSDKNENDEGEYIHVSFDWDIAAINNKNTHKCIIKYRGAGKDWVNLFNGDTSTYKGSYSGIFKADIDLTYEVQITLTDYFTSTIQLINVAAAYTLMDFAENGRSVTFGEVSTNEVDVMKLADSWILKSETISNGVYKNKHFFDNGSIRSAKWVKLGDVSLNKQGASLIIDCLFGKGQNGNAEQNVLFKIAIMRGWASSSKDTTSLGLTVLASQNWDNGVRVGLEQSNINDGELWVYLTERYSTLSTHIVSDVDGSFSYKGKAQTDSPTLTKEATYYVLANMSDIPTKTSQLTNDSGFTAPRRRFLWSNDNLGSFSPQTVTLNDDINNYDEIFVVTAWTKNYPYQHQHTAVNLGGTYLYSGYGIMMNILQNGKAYRREFKPTNTTCQFYNCYIHNTYGSTAVETNNDYLIPLRIVGVKY